MYQYVQTKQKLWRSYPQLAQVTTDIMNSDLGSFDVNTMLVGQLCMITHHMDHQQINSTVTENFFHSSLHHCETNSTCWNKIEDWQFYTMYHDNNQQIVLNPNIEQYHNTHQQLLQYRCDHEFSNHNKILFYSQQVQHVPNPTSTDNCTLTPWTSIDRGFVKKFFVPSNSVPDIHWCFEFYKFYSGPNVANTEIQLWNQEPCLFGITCKTNTISYVLTEIQKYTLVASLLLKIEDLFMIPLCSTYADSGHRGTLPLFQKIDCQ